MIGVVIFMLFLLGMVLGVVLERVRSRDSFDLSFKYRKESPIKEGHLKPKYYGYHGGFWALNRCTNNDCGVIGLYEDLHESSPCQFCGHKVKPFSPGKWSEVNGVRQWVFAEGFKSE